jgi:integrase
MATARISKKSVDALSCPAGKDRTFLWDDDLAGFGVAAFPSGTKAYVVQFRKDGRSRRSRIGLHGRVTPEEARSMAKKMLGQVEGGSDPIADRKAARSVPTLRQVADDFMRLHMAAKRKASTAAEYARLLNSYILPALGSRRVIDIKRADVAKMHSSVSEHAPHTANRAVAVLSSVWSWAGRREVVSFAENPAKGIERNREEGRERYLTGEELARLGDALREAEIVGLPYQVDRELPNSKHAPKEGTRRQIDPMAIAAIRLLILTGARLREILHARWSELDFQRGMIHLADSKTGRKPIYLSAAALEVLAALPKVEGNPFVIPGAEEGASRSDLNRPWRAIRKAAGLDDVRIHDLRHSFASVGAGASLGLPVIGRLLGHSQPATTARYAHLDADPMRKAADTIGNTIAAAMSASEKATVIPLIKRKSN